jgi:hypothetical protein
VVCSPPAYKTPSCEAAYALLDSSLPSRHLPYSLKLV